MPHLSTLPGESAHPRQLVSWLLPRADSVLLIAPRGDADVRIDSGNIASRCTHTLRAGNALMVSAGERPVHLNGRDFDVHPVACVVTRLLAFHDHSMQLQRPLPADRRAAAILPVAEDLRDTDTAQRWLIRQLLADGDHFREAARLWASREAYQLIRFVLENPHCGVQQLADRYGLSVAQFRRIGRKAFGRSLKEQLRLLRAGRVLHRYADTGHTFTRLASDFGFSSPSHFCSEIKSLLGKSPSSIFQSVHLP